jgi:hypothetical protein
MTKGLSIVNEKEKIEISNTITPEDKKLWDIMFAYARPRLKFEERHEIPTAELIRAWFPEKTEEDLKDSFRRLTFSIKHVVKVSPRRKTYHAFAPLPTVSIHDGICYYSYCTGLQRLAREKSIASCLALLGITLDYRLKKTASVVV